MKIVAFTPIRLNSTRLPMKSVRQLDGWPLLNYQISTVNSLVRDGFVDTNYVFCSQPSSLRKAVFEPVTYLKRDPRLDGDKVLGHHIYEAFVEKVDADLYVLYHVTSPMLTRTPYIAGLQAITKGGHDSAFTVVRHQTFAWIDEQPLNYSPIEVPQTQNIKPVFTETSGFYMFTKEAFNGGRRIGDRPFMVEVNPAEGIDIDTQEDFNMCAALIRGGWKQ